MSEPMAPEGRMVVAAFCLLFFGAFAAGALNTARQEWRWRNGEQVRGVMIKQGRWYHYEFTPVKGAPPIVGAKFYRKQSSEPDGVVDDWVHLQYDPHQPEILRAYNTRGTANSGFGRFLFTASMGSMFGLFALVAVWKLLRAWYDKRTAAS